MAGMEAFEAYFRRADLNQDGRISGQEAVAFFQGANLPQQVLAQVWMHADQTKAGFLGRPEFFNALRLVTVAQSGRQLTPDIVQSALYGPAAARIPPPKIATGPSPPQMGAAGAPRPQGNAAMAPAPGQVGATQMNPSAAPRPQGSAMMPASTQIGSAPQVNAGAVPRSQGINSMMPAASQGGGLGAMQPTQFAGPRGMQTQPPNMGFNQQLPPSSTGFMRPSQVGTPATSLQATGINQVSLGGGSMGGSVGWQGGNVGSVGGVSQATPGAAASSQATPGGYVSSVGGVSQATPGAAVPSQATPGGFGLALPSAMGMAPGQQVQAMPSSSLPPQSNSAVLPQDSKALVLSGNGPSSGSRASTDIFSALSQPKLSVSTPALPTSTLPSSSGFMSTPTGSQNLTNLAQLGSLQGTPTVGSGGSQPQQTQPITKPSVPAPTAPGVSATVSNSTSQWPKVTQSDIQKYTKVFGDVDRNRVGKITGAEARTLFLSWRLPREVLKQVWDLSDQDNDGMLSLREFCIALYLMERHRAGTPLPPALPDSLKYDETLLRATGLPSTAYNGPSWQQNPGLPHRGFGAPGVPAGGMRPPLPPHLHSQTDGATRPGQPRSHMPGMDNHAAAQASKDDKSGVNSAVQEVADAPKKVEVEKQILDSREKLEYYRTKMQDLVLYKSRCDNRLNEITERESSDKREVESLAKKYKEKYKRVVELASKLAVEEAAFRDVQERKVELHDALVKMVQGGSVEGLLQVRADRIQYQLEEMKELMSLFPKKILLRWMNFLLKKGGFQRTVTNFSSDIEDSEAYACLLNVLAPECSAKPFSMSVKDLLHRARLVLEHADRMGCKRYLTPKDIVDGLPNLNLAFVAHIFQKRNGFSKQMKQVSFVDGLSDDAQVSREEGSFLVGINSLGISTYINNVFKDLRNGWVPTLLGYSAQGAGRFGFYEFFKKYYSDIAGPEYAQKYKTLIYLAGSASVEIIADVALCPFEAVEVCVQMQPGFVRGLGDGLPKFVKPEGALGLYKGLVPLWGRQIPYTMMKFASFETIVELIYKHAVPIPKSKCSKPSQLGISFAGGYIAGVFCAIVSHPAYSLVFS